MVGRCWFLSSARSIASDWCRRPGCRLIRGHRGMQVGLSVLLDGTGARQHGDAVGHHYRKGDAKRLSEKP